jgi:hypothetical protein
MLAVAREIRTLYDPLVHSRELTQYYVFDLVPHNVVANMQAVLLLGMVEDLNDNIECIHNFLPKIKHLNTLGKFTFK